MSAKGTNAHGDPKLCMVVGCGGKGIYRTSLSKRGYCSKHKHMTHKHMAARCVSDNLASFLERKLGLPNGQL
jgi:hypothetical protein